MILRNDIVALRSLGLVNFLFVSVFTKSHHFSEELRLLRKSSIFIKKGVLKNFKHLEREERRRKERET